MSKKKKRCKIGEIVTGGRSSTTTRTFELLGDSIILESFEEINVEDRSIFTETRKWYVVDDNESHADLLERVGKNLLDTAKLLRTGEDEDVEE